MTSRMNQYYMSLSPVSRNTIDATQGLCVRSGPLVLHVPNTSVSDKSNSPVIDRRHAVSVAPIELVAVHVYVPSSSGNTSLIVSVAVPFLYFRSTISDELIGLPFFDHVIDGSGSPATAHCRCSRSPSAHASCAGSVAVKAGRHISESSGGTVFLLEM